MRAHTHTYARRYQDRIARHVLKVQELRGEREDAGCADKETKRIIEKGKRKRAKVRSLLQEMYTWQSLGTSQPPSTFELTVEQLACMWRPDQPMPWGEAAGRAAEMYHGRLYHSVATDLARDLEELAVVRVERARFEWRLQYAWRQMRAAWGRHMQAGCTGAAFLLSWRMHEVSDLIGEASLWRVG